MKIFLWYIGKNKQSFINDGIEFYKKKLVHYTKFELEEFNKIKIGKNDNPAKHKKIEADYLLNKIPNNAFLVLLDERGKTYSSIKFSKWLDKQIATSSKDIIFLIGGAYGFDQQLYARSDMKLSLSDMTFSHQIIRVAFLEQLYRAFTIIKGEKYHNE